MSNSAPPKAQMDAESAWIGGSNYANDPQEKGTLWVT